MLLQQKHHKSSILKHFKSSIVTIATSKRQALVNERQQNVHIIQNPNSYGCDYQAHSNDQFSSRLSLSTHIEDGNFSDGLSPVSAPPDDFRKFEVIYVWV